MVDRAASGADGKEDWMDDAIIPLREVASGSRGVMKTRGRT